MDYNGRIDVFRNVIKIYIHFRYGLVSFESTAIIFNIGGGNAKFGTADQLHTSSFSIGGATEDGYVGIDAILREYNFREDADIRKHIVLFTDEVL